ncbi:TonB-dependent receptor domain-containing protein [Candidatus Blochmannia ocreatus (nom. nud.)]|uniref:TonB-dependent receptor n=1 Tax=Candidatus Blochmannia ocreatus (nom. nud.) TaxID=251538 RepID=A0ABY4SU35_9ENTR|nr:TonB-dependent receptor [Candidatus Blochmannia ocreatus]URJ24894.1 TonB-dependent receptor [Candidatus Blochmannia ocreatus]
MKCYLYRTLFNLTFVFLIYFLSIIFFFSTTIHSSVKDIHFSRNTNFDELQFNTDHDTSLLLSNREYGDIITIFDEKSSPTILIYSPVISLQSSNITDTADYLKTISGFSIRRHGGVNNELLFRGMSGSRMRILMDHGEILGACASHMDPSSAYITAENFDILNIIKGPQTVLWGPMVSGSTLQFERYCPNFYRSNIQLRSNALVGSNNKIIKNIDTIVGDKSGYIRLIGNTAYSNDYCDGHKNYFHSGWYKWNADATLSYNFYENNTHLEINLGQGNGYANYADRSMDGLCFARESYGIKIENIDFMPLLDKLELQFWYYYINHVMGYNTKYSNPELFIDMCCGISDKKDYHCNDNNSNINNVDRLIWGFRGITVTQLQDIQCSSGIDVQINRHRRFDRTNYSWKKNVISQDFGVFTELVLDSVSNMRWIGGMRLEHSIFDFDSFIWSEGYSKIYPAGFIRYENNVNPLLLYYIGCGTSLCFPNYWEFISTNLVYNDENVSKNNDLVCKLKPERTIQLDIGANFQFLNINGWVSSYAGYIKDFVISTAQNNYLLFSKESNIIKNAHVKTCGAEAGVQYKFSNYCCVESNMFWAWGYNSDDRCSLTQMPPLEGRIIGQWIHGDYSVNFLWRLFAPRSNKCIILSQNLLCNRSNNVFISQENIVDRVAGCGTLSTYLVWNGSKYYKFSIGVDNLLNHSYREYLSARIHKRFGVMTAGKPINEPGRVWWVKLGMIL